MPVDVPASSGAVSITSAKGQQIVGWAASVWGFDPGMFGGYAATARTARRAITTYGGVSVPAMSGTLLLDGWSERRSVAPACRQLEQMASPSGPGELTPPQAVKVDGSVALPGRWWVIASLTPGDQVILRDSDGSRMRQDYEIVLVAPPVDAVVVTNGRRYTTRQGDTPLRIASAQLGKASRWKELKDARGKRFTNSKRTLKTGSIVLLP